MKTTLNLDDELLREARRQAAEADITLTQLFEAALREHLDDQPPEEPYVFNFPAVDCGPPMVDVADRDAVYDILDGFV
jgi:hypothetical protein